MKVVTIAFVSMALQACIIRNSTSHSDCRAVGWMKIEVVVHTRLMRMK